MGPDIIFRIDEETPVTFKLTEGEQKPEQEKSVVPKYTPFSVTPDPGKTLSRVNVAAIPDPTAVETFTQNGKYNVARVGTAVVAVPMPAGTKQITENGTGIDVAAFAFADVNVPQGVFPQGTKVITENGIENVREYENVNVQVPQPSGKITITENGNDVDIAQYSSADIAVPQGVFPAGTLDITENGNDINVETYQKVNVNVPGLVPTETKHIEITQNGTTQYDVTDFAEAEIVTNVAIEPEKGLVLGDYDTDGQPHSAKIIGMTILPPNYANSLFYFFGKNVTLTLPADIIKIGNNGFSYPRTVYNVIYNGNVPDIEQNTFSNNTSIMLYDFSRATRIPSLYSTSSLTHANGCILRIPASLSDTTLGVGNGWESATNWAALTNIVWEVV